ncbi:hypothetical protein [Dyadobacter sp. 22481]|uniref:hypothetical protein n=1 Tax=Dyadobacter sp. 22481 TaxID=3453926 RepID=UPI003F864BEF
MNLLEPTNLFGAMCAVSSGIFDSLPVSLVCVSAFLGLLLFLGWKSEMLDHLYRELSDFVQKQCAMPDLSQGQIIPLFWRLIRSNWYTVLLIAALWVLLFEIDPGSDLIVSYIDELLYDSLLPFGRFGSLYLLFFATLLMTLSIWTIPFYLISKDRILRITQNDNRKLRFYVGCRILSLFAIMPFFIVANGFFFRFVIKERPLLETLGINVMIVILMTFLEAKVFGNKYIKYKLIKSSRKIVAKIRGLTRNYYFVLLIQLLLIELLYVSLTSVLTLFLPDTNYIVGIFMLLSGMTVFRLLFFTDGRKMTKRQINARVRQLLSADTFGQNKKFYHTLFWSLGAANLTFFLLPSLTRVNTIYVVLTVFGFLIIFVDLCRFWTDGDSNLKKIAGYLGILAFLVAPNISPRGQFSVPLQNLEFKPSGKYSCSTTMGKGLGPVDSTRLLEQALYERFNEITSRDSAAKNNVYVVCAMGGGSRAGYFTAAVLQVLDDSIADFYNHTLFYSTISGGSVGTYHYLRRKSDDKNKRVGRGYLTEIYGENYNSSGMFGLLLGDAFEGAFGGLIGSIRKYVGIDHPMAPPYRDRNVRIRQEYDFALHAALAPEIDPDIEPNSNYSKPKQPKTDMFQGYFLARRKVIPIHFVNTFEVNTGRRTVLSPYVANDTLIFSNAILPLQDTAFSRLISNQDITYREAVNMSELFPFLSAASTIGDNSVHQFVDGGYYENYGLATAFDVVERLVTKYPQMRDQIKILLIKNGLQRPVLEKKTRQLIAPLVGVINAPFTGHANALQAEGIKRFKRNFVILEFNEKSDTSRVSLTRALTKNHMKIMDGQAKKQVSDSLKSITRRAVW